MNGRSDHLFQRALEVLPGGVSSPVRAFRAVGGTPRFVAAGQGAWLRDADGNRLLDFVQSWGPLILGHAHPAVIDAVRDAAAAGLTYGAPHEREVQLAERVVDSYPGIEQVRFTSSGTEAVMSALRLARGVTGRSRIVKFSGCYHGHADSVLVAAGSGAVTFGAPASAGVPAELAALTTVLPLDDEAALRHYMEQHGAGVAAIVIEPIPANNGLLLQRHEFLQAVRDCATAAGARLIFDEVISGFRVARGGAAELYGITPDLVTFGKILGGGMPVGAFAGPRSDMALLAPQGPVYQAGTLSGNPVAMAAGLTTLELLDNNRILQQLETLGARLQSGVQEVLRRTGLPAQFVRCGSIFWLHFGELAPRAAEQISPSAAEIYRRFFHACLDRKVYLAPSAYEVGFLGAAHTEVDIDHALEVFATALPAAFEEQ